MNTTPRQRAGRAPAALIRWFLALASVAGCASESSEPPGDDTVAADTRASDTAASDTREVTDTAASDTRATDTSRSDATPDLADTASPEDVSDVGDTGPVCGDGLCEALENDTDCAQDCACVAATRLWFEDFETGDYARWTSSDYGNDWKDGFCHANGFSAEQALSPTHSHRSEITCVSDESHRGYGGLQFAGDAVVAAYTNQGTGIDAPHGVVNTYWSWLEAPYNFENGRWFSFWTVNTDCGWNERVITLGLEDASWRLTPAHIENTGGTVTFEPDAPAFPRGQWVRTTLYLNTHDGTLHLWQDGHKVLAATFSRPTSDICQWHWGAYASSDNDDVVLYEDDNVIWKLHEPWSDFAVEPYFGESVRVCDE